MRGGASRSYSIFFRSVWQIPQASTRTRISPIPIWGVGTSSTETVDRPMYTAALMVSGTTLADACVSEATVCNKFSQRSRRNPAPFPQFHQLRRDGDRAPHRRRQNARRTEPAVGQTGGVQIDME